MTNSIEQAEHDVDSINQNDNYWKIILDGLWHKNPALVQLLGLCPLLAVSNSTVNSLGLGIATLLVFVGSNMVVSLIRHHVTDAIRLPVFVMVIATFTTCAELLMKAFAYELYQILGIFIPLIVTNCAILGRSEAYASKNSLLPSMIDGFMMGLGFLLVLIVLGAFRELLGTGTLFDNMDLLFGEHGQHLVIHIYDFQQNFLLAILPPGAFMLAGLLIAFRNKMNTFFEQRHQPVFTVKKGSKRVRTTEIR